MCSLLTHSVCLSCMFIALWRGNAYAGIANASKVSFFMRPTDIFKIPPSRSDSLTVNAERACQSVLRQLHCIFNKYAMQLSQDKLAGSFRSARLPTNLPNDNIFLFSPFLFWLNAGSSPHSRSSSY